MKITAQDLIRFGIVDEIVAEPSGGAHRDPQAAMAAAADAITAAFASLRGLDRAVVRKMRRDKFLAIGRNKV
jgi:acetyl-CoA carboxylase carboxyl transferase subunit alpha